LQDLEDERLALIWRFVLEFLTIGVMGRAGVEDLSGAREIRHKDLKPCKAPQSGK
jgi:hypothetical protein